MNTVINEYSNVHQIRSSNRSCEFLVEYEPLDNRLIQRIEGFIHLAGNSEQPLAFTGVSLPNTNNLFLSFFALAEPFPDWVDQIESGTFHSDSSRFSILWNKSPPRHFLRVSYQYLIEDWVDEQSYWLQEGF